MTNVKINKAKYMPVLLAGGYIQPISGSLCKWVCGADGTRVGLIDLRSFNRLEVNLRVERIPVTPTFQNVRYYLKEVINK